LDNVAPLAVLVVDQRQLVAMLAPDDSSLAGLYDNADFDDIVLLITSLLKLKTSLLAAGNRVSSASRAGSQSLTTRASRPARPASGDRRARPRGPCPPGTRTCGRAPRRAACTTTASSGARERSASRRRLGCTRPNSGRSAALGRAASHRGRSGIPLGPPVSQPTEQKAAQRVTSNTGTGGLSFGPAERRMQMAGVPT